MARKIKSSLELLAEWKDIRISREKDLLILENSRIRRVLDLSPGAPRTVSLQTADGTELASAENPVCDIGFIGLHGAMKKQFRGSVVFLQVVNIYH